MVGIFMIDHLIQAFRKNQTFIDLEYVGIAVELGYDWLEPVFLFLKGLNVFNINIGSEVYIATVVT